MSDTAGGGRQTDEPTEKLNNGAVTLELEISDPVADLGIETRRLNVEVNGSMISQQLADHIWNEYGVDVEEYADVEVVE